MTFLSKTKRNENCLILKILFAMNSVDFALPPTTHLFPSFPFPFSWLYIIIYLRHYYCEGTLFYSVDLYIHGSGLFSLSTLLRWNTILRDPPFLYADQMNYRPDTTYVHSNKPGLIHHEWPRHNIIIKVDHLFYLLSFCNARWLGHHYEVIGNIKKKKI